MDTDKGRQRLEVLYSGQVQGVGFRYTTCQIARRFKVAGSVRNLPDGRVEVIAEGEANELEQFFAAVESDLADHIRNSQRQTYPPRGEFRGFDVRF